MKYKKTLKIILRIAKIILKNILALLTGMLFGVAVLFIFLKPMLYYAMPKNAGLGVIALAPALMIIYGILLAGGGGILGLITYNLIVFLKKRKKRAA